MTGVVEHFAVAGGLATLALSTLLEGSQGLRLSRLSLPFLVGTAFSDDRRRAMAMGFVFYLAGGFVFAAAYWLAFAATGRHGWLEGAVLGAVHGAFLLVAVTPLLPFVHPRMASEHDGPATAHGIEPPGFMALNYGAATPVVTLLAHSAYGAILGALYPG
ncbi:MAG: hypothetical protein ACM31L_05290 [Actinomycetota bacterium]